MPALAAVPLIGARELARLARRGRDELDRYDPKTTKLLPAPLQPPLDALRDRRTRHVFRGSDPRRSPCAATDDAIAAGRRSCWSPPRSTARARRTLAINLAQSLAMLGIRTLLIDGDLRNPQVTRSLCPRAEAGLLEVAIGRTAPEDAILVDPSTGLSILPSTRHQGGRIHHGADVLRPDRRRSRSFPSPLRTDRHRTRRRWCRWSMAARWPNWPIASFWRWPGTRPPARCCLTPWTCYPRSATGSSGR